MIILKRVARQKLFETIGSEIYELLGGETRVKEVKQESIRGVGRRRLEFKF